MDTASGVATTDQWYFRVVSHRVRGQVVRFIFAAKTDSDRFASGAAATLKSFRPTTAADLAQIRKVTLKMVIAKAVDTADSLAKQMASLSRGTELVLRAQQSLSRRSGRAPGQQIQAIVVGYR